MSSDHQKSRESKMEYTQWRSSLYLNVCCGYNPSLYTKQKSKIQYGERKPKYAEKKNTSSNFGGYISER